MYSRTSIVYENPFEITDPSTIEGNFYYNPFEVATNKKNLNPFYYRVRNCDTNLTSDTPANQYQRQKIIQNTVRVASSLYTMNLGALNAYAKPTPATYNVCWNQMSDRPVPSVQKTYVPTKGGTIGSNSTKHTVTGPRPGAQSPGGIGCDIKHNSYDRYLNRLKGKAPLRRGVIPPNFGDPIPFNRAFPVYGGKITKTSIVNNCNCPIETKTNDSKIYNNPLYYPETNITCTDVFKVGDYVYTTEGSSPYYVKALITGYDTNTQIYMVNFVDSGGDESKLCNQLRIYFPCECLPSQDINESYVSTIEQEYSGGCLYPPGYLELKSVL
jgi:hypothetical protein